MGSRPTTAALLVTLSVAAASGVAARAASDLPAKRVDATISSWRARVGRGPLSAVRKRELLRQVVRSAEAVAASAHARVSFRRATVYGGTRGPAIYLDLVTDAPARLLRHGRPLVRALTPYFGGWAIRLRDRRGGTVWIAGFGGSSGFVWSRPDLDRLSPVAHW